MNITWVDRIGTYDVVRREIPRPEGKPYYLNSSTLIGVLHTTEGNTVASAWSTLNASSSAPHFILGQNSIVQCRPLNVQGAGLRSNNANVANVHAQIQLELVGSSRTSLWMPVAGTLAPTIAVLAYCNKYLGIPLTVPNNWPDDVSDMPLPWAIRNRRRRQAETGLWPIEKGWWMHLEVPYQSPTWHWDCGALRRTELLAQAAAAVAAM
ncbi:MAG: hypothetical protein ABIW82_02855 [Dokdonella sp.]